MTGLRFIGETEQPTIDIPTDALGSPGQSGCLIIKPIFDADEMGERKFESSEERVFLVSARPEIGSDSSRQFRTDVNQEVGNSYILLNSESDHSTISLDKLNFRMYRNDEKLVSLITCEIGAVSAIEARHKFVDTLNIYLDWICFNLWIPFKISTLWVKDPQSHISYIYFSAPPKYAGLPMGRGSLSDEMRPVFALYREAQSAESPYYRLLCFYKIAEGILGPLRTRLNIRAKKDGLDLKFPKNLVPDHPGICEELRMWVGKPIKQLFEKFLQHEYRNAISHFELKRKSPLNVGSSRDYQNFSQISFLADICVRELIQCQDQVHRLLDDLKHEIVVI